MASLNKRQIAFVAMLLLLMHLFEIKLAWGVNNYSADTLVDATETAIVGRDQVLNLIEKSQQYARTNLSKSLNYAQKSLEIANKTHDNEIISLALSNIAKVCFNHGLIDQATTFYYALKDLHETKGDQEKLSRALVGIAAVKVMTKDFEGARLDLIQLLESLETGNLRTAHDTLKAVLLPVIYNNLGIVYANLNQPDEALRFYTKGIARAERAKDNEEILSQLLNNLGKLYSDLGQDSMALKSFNEALNIRFASNDQIGIAASFRNLSRFYIERGEFDKAFEYASQGYEIAKRANSIQLLSNFSNQLFEFYEHKHKADSALKYHKLYKKYSDQFNSEETQKEIARIEAIAQFQKQELLYAMESKRKELRLYIIAGLLLLIMVILVLALFLVQSKMKRLRLLNENMRMAMLNSQLEKKNLESEIEIKNKELTTNVIYQIQKNEFIKEIINKLLKLGEELDEANQRRLLVITKEIEKAREKNVWKEFEIRFHNVHNDFYERLIEKFPDLTQNERRLCSFLRLNMSTKEIASITGQMPKTIDMARTRLRKKLNLTNSEISLSDFLAKF